MIEMVYNGHKTKYERWHTGLHATITSGITIRITGDTIGNWIEFLLNPHLRHTGGLLIAPYYNLSVDVLELEDAILINVMEREKTYPVYIPNDRVIPIAKDLVALVDEWSSQVISSAKTSVLWSE